MADSAVTQEAIKRRVASRIDKILEIRSKYGGWLQELGYIDEFVVAPSALPKSIKQELLDYALEEIFKRLERN